VEEAVGCLQEAQAIAAAGDAEARGRTLLDHTVAALAERIPTMVHTPTG
jgi:hypothetical protein